MEIVLSIAGSDPSAGAGIQQDLKTISAVGCYGATVITALTSQNTLGVQGVMEVPAAVVASQMESVLSDLDVRTIKIGMIPNAEVAQQIVDTLKAHYTQGQGELPPVVYDPVMISTSGRRLMTADTIGVVTRQLLPLCTIVTPNIPEASHLWGQTIADADDIEKAGRALVKEYGVNFLIKGGHAEGDDMADRLFAADGTTHDYHTPRIETRNLHGTGCTLSSAIASYLAKGQPLPEAVGLAKDYVTRAIEAGRSLCIGRGNGPLGGC